MDTAGWIAIAVALAVALGFFNSKKKKDAAPGAPPDAKKKGETT